MQKSANVLGAEGHALKQTSIFFRTWISVFCKKLWYQVWEMLLTSLLRFFFADISSVFFRRRWITLLIVSPILSSCRPSYPPIGLRCCNLLAKLNGSWLHSFHFARNCWFSTPLIGYQPKTPCGIPTSPTSVRRFAHKPTKTDMKTFRCPLTFALSHILQV